MDPRLTIVAGPACGALGAAICQRLQTEPVACACQRFPDGETLVELSESVRGRHVYLLQSTSPPVDQHLMELLLLADACRRAGAARLTAVLPYFGYARQDRRRDRRSLGARVAAAALESARLDRLMVVDAHTPALEGFFGVPVDQLTAVPVLAAAVAPWIERASVVVAPDLGAVKLARAYANALHLPMAFVHKTRLNGEAVEAGAVVGDVRGRVPLIVDDMLSTGATVQAAIGALAALGAAAPATVVATHALLVGRAREALGGPAVGRIFVTDTVAADTSALPRLAVCSVAPVLATAIQRDHAGESLMALRASV